MAIGKGKYLPAIWRAETQIKGEAGLRAEPAATGASATASSWSQSSGFGASATRDEGEAAHAPSPLYQAPTEVNHDTNGSAVLER